MGWVDGQYYQKHVKEEGHSNKITMEQEAFNRLKIDEVREGIQIVQEQCSREGKVDNKTKLDAEIQKANREPIEYVIEEAEEKTSGEEMEL